MATKKKSSTNKYLTEATMLGDSAYSPAFAQIEANAASNTAAYSAGSSQRIGSLNAELGSMEAAHNTVQGQLGQLGAETGTIYQQALAASQKDYQARQNELNTTNSNMLGTLQSEMNARGLTGNASSSRLASNAAYHNNILAAIQQIGEGAMGRQGLAAQDTLKGVQGSEQMLNTTNKSNARGLAQSELMGLYNAYLQKKMELEGQKTVTEKERGNYIVQTAMTLKEQAYQRALQKANAAASNAIAQGNLDFKYQNLGVKTQLEYDKMDRATAQNDIENKFKERGYTDKQALDAAKLLISTNKFNLDVDKFNWKKAQPPASNSNADLAAAIAAMMAGK